MSLSLCEIVHLHKITKRILYASESKVCLFVIFIVEGENALIEPENALIESENALIAF